MVYDCFPFFDELDLLEIRLAQHDSQVDRFVLCESTTTHMGDPKPLYFAEHRSRYGPWLDKILHLVYEPPEGDYNPWIRENEQRKYLGRALEDCGPMDVVLHSDLDEILHPEVIRDYVWYTGRWANPMLGIPQLRPAYFYVNCQALDCNWNEARLLRWGWMQGTHYRLADLHDLRHFHGHLYDCLPLRVPEAGWHFGWLGGYEAIKTKFRALPDRVPKVLRADTEANIRECLRTGKDLWTQCLSFTPKPLDACSLPPYLREHLDRFQHLIHPQQRKTHE